MDICPFIHYDGYIGSESPGVPHLTAPPPPGGAAGNTGSSTFAFSLAADSTNNGNNPLASVAAAAAAAGPKLSPVIYLGEAPVSDFERRLRLPGLMEIFRQNGRAAVRWAEGEGEGGQAGA